MCLVSSMALPPPRLRAIAPKCSRDQTRERAPLGRAGAATTSAQRIYRLRVFSSTRCRQLLYSLPCPSVFSALLRVAQRGCFFLKRSTRVADHINQGARSARLLQLCKCARRAFPVTLRCHQHSVVIAKSSSPLRRLVA